MKEQNGKRCCADKSQGRRQSPNSSGASLIPGSRRRESKAETQDQKESVMGKWLGSQVIYLDFSLGTIKDPMCDLSQLLWKKSIQGGFQYTSLFVSVYPAPRSNLETGTIQIMVGYYLLNLTWSHQPCGTPRRYPKFFIHSLIHSTNIRANYMP